MLTLIQFLSTLSLRRATAPPYNLMIQHTNFYPRSPCGERRPASHLSKFNTSYFYPRSPCGERPLKHEPPARRKYFYPRSPCGERLQLDKLPKQSLLFLSTLSLRRATVLRKVPILGIKYFYPRSPCGERHRNWRKQSIHHKISIHALLAESDPGCVFF